MCEDALAVSSYRGTGGMSSRGPGAASPFVREDDIVGIEHDVEQLMKLILEGNVKNFLAISVFGMGWGEFGQNYSCERSSQEVKRVVVS